MARLPKVGDDKGTWGGILNDYLEQSHNDDGTLKNDTVGAPQLRPNSVTGAAIANGAVNASKLASSSDPTTGQALTYDGSSLAWSTITSSGSVPDATDTDKGLVRLAGDIAGTASYPLIAADAITEAKLDSAVRTKLNAGIADGAVSTVKLADDAVTAAKLADDAVTDATVAAGAAIAMTKIAGLSTALDGKAADAAVVHLAGGETISGNKNFTGELRQDGNAVVTTVDGRLSDERTPTNGSVSTAKLADDAVTETKLDSAVRTKLNSGVADGAITTVKLADGAVTAEKVSGLDSVFVPQDAIVVLADRHGLAGDWTGGVGGTGTNDTAALQALVNSSNVPEGSTIRFTSGKTYRIDNVLSTKSLTLDFSGANVVTSPNAGTGPMIRFAGSVGTGRSIAATAVNDTQLALTAVSNAADFSAGQHVYIRDNYVIPDWTGNPTGAVGRGELRVVTAVDTGAGILTLDRGVEWAYATSPQVHSVLKLLKRPAIVNVGTIYEINPNLSSDSDVSNANGHHLFAFDLCDSPVVDGANVEGWDMHVFNAYRCLSPVVRRVSARWPFRPQTGGCGYLARFERSHNGLATLCRGNGVRHLVDQVCAYDSGSLTCASENGVNCAYPLHGCLAKRAFSIEDFAAGTNVGWNAGNPSFGADYGFRIVRPTYRGSHAAVFLRGGSTDMTITEPDFVSSYYAAVVASEAAKGLVIEGGRIEMISPVTGGANALGQVAITARCNVAWNGSYQSGYEVGDVTVRRTKVVGAMAYLDLNSIGDVVVENVKFESTTASGIGLIRINARETSNVPTGIRIANTRASGTGYYYGIQIQSAPSGSMYEITGNSMPNPTVNTGGGLTAPAVTALTVRDNTFKSVAASISLSGDVDAAKLAGARILSNVPNTFDTTPLDGATIRGDVNTTLTSRANRPLQIWNAPLTAARTATLSTTNARTGDAFRICRTAASTGASALAIGSTGKSLAAGQWADIVYDGSAWTVVASGTQ